MPAGEEGGSVLWQSARTLLLPTWAEHLVSFLIYAAAGYFLIELNNRFGIIRMRASVQTAIYFLLVTVCPEMHLLYAGDVAAIAFLFSIYFLFKSYQQSQAAGYLFYSFLFIGAGSIFFPQLTFFSVLWLFEAYRFQSLTFRSFCGALIGWTMPYWMLFGHAFFYDQMELFYHPFRELATFGDLLNLQVLQPWELATLGYLFVLFIVSRRPLRRCRIRRQDTYTCLFTISHRPDALPLHTDCAAAVAMQQPSAVAYDKQQYTDRTPFRADQQQNIECIFHCFSGLPHPLIRF